uniref:PBPb domain-containing protein n=1 Tax=Macrostomum lignano TaxID=282301 RepID=A0A1I8ISN0_9PLAT
MPAAAQLARSFCPTQNSSQLYTGRNCSSSNSSWDASSRINAALSNIILQRWFGASCQAEVCQSTEQVALRNGRDGQRVQFLLQYRRAMESFGSTSRLNQPVFATVPSRLDAPMSTAFESGSADAVFTPGPSVFDLAEVSSSRCCESFAMLDSESYFVIKTMSRM